jgi:hypothetical protein
MTHELSKAQSAIECLQKEKGIYSVAFTTFEQVMNEIRDNRDQFRWWGEPWNYFIDRYKIYNRAHPALLTHYLNNEVPRLDALHSLAQSTREELFKQLNSQTRDVNAI